MIGLGIGLKFGGAVTIDQQAQDHFNRVVADGGTIPAGLVGCDAWFKSVKGVYGVSDITSAISSGHDPHYLGYKLGAGSGATLGSATQKLYSCCGSTGDLIQTTAASQPLILPHTGTNYVWLPRVASNNFTTPSATANRISGDIDIIVNCKSATSSVVQTMVLKGNGTSYNYAFDISSTNTLRLIYGGFTISESTATITPTTLKWYRVTRNSSTGDVIFYTGDNGTTWVQLGATRTTAAGSLPLTTDSVVIGDNTASPGNGFLGLINRATISNTIGGNPVVDFNPARYSASTSQTQWTSSTGEVWTINTGTAATGYKCVVVDRTITQGDGVDDVMTQTSNYLLFVNGTNYTSLRKFELTTINKSILSMGNNPNEFDYKHTTNRVNGTEPISTPNTLLNFYAMQRNEASLQAVGNLNNGATVTTTIPAIGTNLNKVYLFASPYIQCGNGIVNTIIVTSSIDNASRRSAMYTAMRQFNNNAF